MINILKRILIILTAPIWVTLAFVALVAMLVFYYIIGGTLEYIITGKTDILDSL